MWVASRRGVEPRTLWVVIGILLIVAVLFAALMPLPGEKDDTTPHAEPAPGGALTPTPPTGPAESSPVPPSGK